MVGMTSTQKTHSKMGREWEEERRKGGDVLLYRKASTVGGSQAGPAAPPEMHRCRSCPRVEDVAALELFSHAHRSQSSPSRCGSLGLCCG